MKQRNENIKVRTVVNNYIYKCKYIAYSMSIKLKD